MTTIAIALGGYVLIVVFVLAMCRAASAGDAAAERAVVEGLREAVDAQREAVGAHAPEPARRFVRGDAEEDGAVAADRAPRTGRFARADAAVARRQEDR